MEQVEPYLTKLYVGNRSSFTCNAWHNFFTIQEHVYQELSVEYFSIVIFEEHTIDLNYGRALTFRLGGEYQECNLAEFAWHNGLYHANEDTSP